MRRFFPLVVVLAALVVASSAAASTLFVVDGRGWGHGVGMSQWGAQGRALRGVGHGDILGFYYRNTTIGHTSVRKVRVLLFGEQSSIKLSSAADFEVGKKTLQGNTVYTAVPAADGKVRIRGVGKFANPATVTPGSANLRVNGARYRGSFKVWVRSGSLAVVNIVGLEDYLLSVVPREMPAWFELEALAAQADAARSYAIRSHLASWFDLYDDTRSQVYAGRDGEDPSGRATTAVRGTSREVVLYDGAVAQTFFSSSNGGYEAASADVWGSSLPYLQPRRDDDDLTAGNPNRYWKHRYSPAALGRALAIGRPHDAGVARNDSGRASTVAFATAAGTVSLGGATVQSRLGLRSTRYWVGVQSLTANRTHSQCKQRLTFSVFAHTVGAVSLEQRRVTGGSWAALPLNKVDETHWTAEQRPCVSTDYRVVSRKATGALLHVPVSPAVGIETARATSMSGHVNPLLTGVPVIIQRRTSSGWKKVTSTPIRSDGSFRAEFSVTEDVYRAKVVPPSSTGLVTGYSPKLTVVMP